MKSYMIAFAAAAIFTAGAAQAAKIELTPAFLRLQNGAAEVAMSPVSVNINDGALEVI